MAVGSKWQCVELTVGIIADIGPVVGHDTYRAGVIDRIDGEGVIGSGTVDIGIGVVGQHVDRDRGSVFVSGVCVVDRYRIVVDAGDRYRDRGGVSAAISVVDRIDERVRYHVAVGKEVEGTRRVVADRATNASHFRARGGA